mmetsp:Transcript_40137/g.105845  ORF Transcript_40137/g.105845 Transcript_40137/m.105845 type:complete len:1246 (-) Transcript_40137:47-3784(-)
MEEGATVEIHSVPAPLEVQAGPTQFRGTKVNPNGKKGHVRLDTRDEHVVVETLDGLCFEVPEGCTREVEHAGPEDGGYDCLWPRSIHQEQEVAHFVSEMLRNRGFCMLHVPEADSLRGEFIRAARADWEYTLLEAEMEEAFLGLGAASKVSWLVGGFGANKASSEAKSGLEIFAGGARHVATLARELSMDPGLIDFEPWSRGCAFLVRVPLAASERQQMNAISLHTGAPEAVGEHIDFLQRRKLCMMHFLESSGGGVELQHLSTGRKYQIPVTRGRLLIFRHDVMSYTYTPRSGATPADDVVLQAWVFEEPPMMRLDHLDGRNDGALADQLLDHMEGLPLPEPESRKVHIMSVAGRFPGDGKTALGAYTAWMYQNDAFIQHPSARWDVDVYYAPDATQFGSEGKSGTQHGGFLSQEDLTSFDNEFFKMPAEQAQIMPPQARMLLECSYEAFHLQGHTQESLRGANIALTVADCGMEWDQFAGYKYSLFETDPKLWAETSCHNAANTSGLRVARELGLTGSVKLVDTACSSSIVSACVNHASLRRFDFDEFKEALSISVGALITPFPFIGMSAAGMVGRGGRCYTFDSSANGFGRGEGCGGITQMVSDDPKVIDNKLGNHASSFVNQDGRSASLTAPNGPSQQSCMRAAMGMENIPAEDITLMETHGTGTALGDPIETGSCRAIFRKRDLPISITSVKSHSGHLEGCAGAQSLAKVLLKMVHMILPSQCHLKQLNSHMDMAGFPGYFPTEITDIGAPHRTAGINGFGFGGTNSHVELWVTCLKGHREPTMTVLKERRAKGQPYELLGGRTAVLELADCILETCPRCWGPMCWRCGAADPMSTGEEGKHSCSAIRKEYSSYKCCSDCYVGEYQYGNIAPSDRCKPPDNKSIFLFGSWDSWSNFEEMRQLLDGEYVGEVRLGETGFEQFQLIIGADEEQSIVPAVSNAAQDARVVGPVGAGQSQCWLIDGRADGALPGTIYEVRFRWGEMSKSLSWRRLARRQRMAPHEWTWTIAGSFTGWQPEEMHRSSSKPGAWEFLGQLGVSGVEKLHFMRDGDPTQRVYPLRDSTVDPCVPIVGPGPCDNEKGWEVIGNPHSLFQARLWVKDCAIMVELKVEPNPAIAWRSLAGTARDTYQLVGSFCGWSLSSATDFTNPDPSRPGLLVSTFYISETCREEFQIVVNRNVSQILHPALPSAPGRGFVLGPEPSETNLHWQVSGLPGQRVEVIFDHAAEDSLSMVTCRVGELMLE